MPMLMPAFIFLHLQLRCYIHPTHPDSCVLFPSAQSSACIPFPSSSFARIIVHTVLISCPNYTFPIYSSPLCLEAMTIELSKNPSSTFFMTTQIKLFEIQNSLHFSYSVVFSFAVSQTIF